MNHELAKQLKEAGFPQDGVDLKHPHTVALPPKIAVTDKIVECNEIFYVPTLPELIEACGADFYSLTYEHPKMWVVKQRYRDDRGAGMFIAENPEEAVANLWLALHSQQ